MTTSITLSIEAINKLKLISKKYDYTISSALRYMIKNYNSDQELTFLENDDKSLKQIVPLSYDEKTYITLKSLSLQYDKISKSDIVEAIIFQFDNRN